MTPLADDEPCRCLLGVDRIRGDDPAGEREWLEQWRKGEDLVRLVVFDVALPDHHPGVVSKGCEQLGLRAVSSLRSSDRLAVDRYPDQVRSLAEDAVVVVGL